MKKICTALVLLAAVSLLAGGCRNPGIESACKAGRFESVQVSVEVRADTILTSPAGAASTPDAPQRDESGQGDNRVTVLVEKDGGRIRETAGDTAWLWDAAGELYVRQDTGWIRQTDGARRCTVNFDYLTSLSDSDFQEGFRLKRDRVDAFLRAFGHDPAAVEQPDVRFTIENDALCQIDYAYIRESDVYVQVSLSFSYKSVSIPPPDTAEN